jgi:RNA polymerase sigma-70 factor (sigma-E family)
VKVLSLEDTGRREDRPELRLVPDLEPSDLRAELPDLYHAHYRSLVRLASFSVDDVETAEEVVQDAFVKLVAGDYRVDPGKEAAYLRSMVLNGARSALRKRQVRRAHTPDAPGLVAAAEDAGVASTEQDRIITALRKLPEQQASVLVLRYYLDLSEADIADTLGIARGSVKSHAHRGLRRLAQLLGDDHNPFDRESPS